MRVMAFSRLQEFYQQPGYADAENPLRDWYNIVSDRDCGWASFHDLKLTYGTASLVGECVVFNIGGNKYRLITQINYVTHMVFVRKILTHKEYDLGQWKSARGCETKRTTNTR